MYFIFPLAIKVYNTMGICYELNVKLLFIQGGDSEALDYLSKLMLALDSYYHPSNHGKHTVSYVFVYVFVYVCVCVCVQVCVMCVFVCVFV